MTSARAVERMRQIWIDQMGISPAFNNAWEGLAEKFLPILDAFAAEAVRAREQAIEAMLRNAAFSAAGDHDQRLLRIADELRARRADEGEHDGGQ